VCVTQLDAKSLERGIACTPGYISSVSCALVAVRHVRFFKLACKTGAKFHVTVGHTTVMGTATFFAAPAAVAREATAEGAADEAARKAAEAARALQNARLPLPTVFDEAAEYLYQEELDTSSPEQWAVLQLEQPLACALPATAVCSHLETDYNLNTCRIAFYGRLLKAVAPEDVHALRIFKWKRKEGQVPSSMLAVSARAFRCALASSAGPRDSSTTRVRSLGTSLTQYHHASLAFCPTRPASAGGTRAG